MICENVTLHSYTALLTFTWTKLRQVESLILTESLQFSAHNEQSSVVIKLLI